MSDRMPSVINQDDRQAVRFRYIAVSCSAVVVGLGLLGLASWYFGVYKLSSILPSYIPMATSTAISFLLLGVILTYQAWTRPTARGRTVAGVAVSLVAAFGLLSFIKLFAGMDLNLEDLLVPTVENFGKVHTNRISPLAGLTFFLSGTNLLLILCRKDQAISRHLAGFLGLSVTIIGAVGIMGYIFGTPLLYGGIVIPMALTTVIAFMLLGVGLVVMTGPDALPLRMLVGPSTQARLLRAFLPLTVAIIMVQGLLHRFIPPPFHNYALGTAVLALMFSLITGMLVVVVGRTMGQAMDLAQAKRQQAEEMLRENEERLQLAQRAANAGTWDWNLVTDELKWSDENYTLFGLSPGNDALSIKTWRQYLLPEDRERASDLVTQAIESKNDLDLEYRIIRVDGEVRWLNSKGRIFRDDAGRALRLIGINVDITTHKQVEEALREALAWTQSVMDSISDGFFTLNDRLQITYFNRTAERLLNRKSEEILHRNLFDVFPEARGSIFEDMYCRGLREKKPLFFETYFGVKPYENWYDIRVYPFKEGIAVYFQVITERKQAEEVLKNQMQFTETLLETIPSPVFYKDASGIYLGCNRAFEKFWGKGREEVIGKDVYEMGPKEIADKYAEMDQKLFERPGSQMYEWKVRAADGSEKEVIFHKASFLDTSGKVGGLIGVILDITERKWTESALAKSEAMLSTILKSSPTGIGLVVDRVLQWVNKTILNLTGYSREELIGQSARIFYPSEAEFNRVGDVKYQQIIEAGWGHVDTQWQRKDGSLIEVHLSSAAVDPANLSAGVVFSAMDITERKQTENEIIRQREELRGLTIRLAEVEELERQRLARELHDQICQSLTSINIALETIMIRAHGESIDQLLSRLANIGAIAEQTSEITRDIMEGLRPTVLDHYGLLGGLRQLGSQFSQRTGVDLEVQGVAPDRRLNPKVELAVFRIAQEALHNVAKHAKATKVILSIEEQGDMVHLIIVDNGIGFDQAQAAQPMKGTKWGLITMSERAMAVGGHCHIESQPSQGTRVAVEVPR